MSSFNDFNREIVKTSLSILNIQDCQKVKSLKLIKINNNNVCFVLKLHNRFKIRKSLLELLNENEK